MALSNEQLARITAKRKAQDSVLPYIASDAQAVNDAVGLLREWVPGKFSPNDVRLYKGIPYKCVQEHDSGPNPHWTPDTAYAQWMQYHGTSIETARPYIQPLGAHDAYQTDEYAIENGDVYRCKRNAVDRPPSVLPDVWEFVSGAGGYEPPVLDEWPIWEPWDNVNEHLHKIGDQVTHNGMHWVSTVGNNHWEPGVHGWAKQN